MNIKTIGFFLILGVAWATPVASQQRSLAATLDVYVFPAEGQAADQQSRDEAECYQWAVGNVGMDPFEASQQATAASAAQIDSFKKAFSVCLEAKKYPVRY